jgi:hypothetical protein
MLGAVFEHDQGVKARWAVDRSGWIQDESIQAIHESVDISTNQVLVDGLPISIENGWILGCLVADVNGELQRQIDSDIQVWHPVAEFTLHSQSFACVACALILGVRTVGVEVLGRWSSV